MKPVSYWPGMVPPIPAPDVISPDPDFMTEGCVQTLSKLSKLCPLLLCCVTHFTLESFLSVWRKIEDQWNILKLAVAVDENF